MMVTRAIGGASTKLPVIGPDGAKKVVNGIMDAYDMDSDYRIGHHGEKYSRDGVTADVTEASPGVVYDQGGLKITMFEVDHRPVTPAVGYRFDYKGQSVVVSGDTVKVPKMIEMARGCDILVHEAVNTRIIELAQRYLDERMYKMSMEMLEYHTPTEEVAEIAREAGAKKLVLTHMVPSPMNHAMAQLFIRGMMKIFRKPIRVGQDLMEVKA
jgi:ribonuclease Z